LRRNELNFITRGAKAMQKKKEKKQEKKKYRKMVLTKHSKLKDITAGVTPDKLGCTKFLF
jgi:hypothetical protein